MTILIIGLRKLDTDIKNMSKDEVENRRLNFLKNLVRTIIDTNQKLDEKVKKKLHKDSKKDKDYKY